MNAAGVLTEMGLSALLAAKDQSKDVPSMARKLALAYKFICAAL